MKAADLVTALGIPADARMDQRVSKKLLSENGATVASDRRLISEGVKDLRWVATLKPTSIGVAEYRDEEREIVEIAVLHLSLRQTARAARLNLLIHRAVPYPVVLVTEQEPKVTLSLATKRRSRNDETVTVLDDDVIETSLSYELDQDLLRPFLEAMSLARQPRLNLRTLYQGWIDTVLALEAGHVTGIFIASASPAQAAVRRAALHECHRFQVAIAALRASAAKERQLSRQVDLNLKIKRLQEEYLSARAKL